MSGEGRDWLRLLVGAWYAAGAVLVIALLFKSQAESLAVRTGYSALGTVLLGFAIVAGVRLAERPGHAGLFGGLTALVSIASLFLLAVDIWSDHLLQQPTRTAVMVVVSLLLGSISMLVDSERDEDGAGIRLARAAAVVGLLSLGALVVIAASGTDVSPRLAGLAAALFLIPTISLPALRAVDSQ